MSKSMTKTELIQALRDAAETMLHQATDFQADESSEPEALVVFCASTLGDDRFNAHSLYHGSGQSLYAFARYIYSAIPATIMAEAGKDHLEQLMEDGKMPDLREAIKGVINDSN